MTAVSLALEMPIGETEVRSRGIGKPVSYLRVANLSLDEKGFLQRMGEVLDSLAMPNRVVYIQGVNPFVSIESLAPLQEHGVALLRSRVAVRVQGAKWIAQVLTFWKAEAHAILFVQDGQEETVFAKLSQAEAKWWQLSGDSYERPYLLQIEHSDPVVFFAHSHMSFELFGSGGTIWSAFDDVRKRFLSEGQPSHR